MAGDINFKLRYIVPLHPGIPRAHTVRKLGPEIPSELALNTEHIIVGTPQLTGFLWNILSLGQCTAHDITEICYQWADTQMTVIIYLGQHTTDHIHHM